jgi:hypothetical protein
VDEGGKTLERPDVEIKLATCVVQNYIAHLEAENIRLQGRQMDYDTAVTTFNALFKQFRQLGLQRGDVESWVDAMLRFAPEMQARLERLTQFQCPRCGSSKIRSRFLDYNADSIETVCADCRLTLRQNAAFTAATEPTTPIPLDTPAPSEAVDAS